MEEKMGIIGVWDWRVESLEKNYPWKKSRSGSRHTLETIVGGEGPIGVVDAGDAGVGGRWNQR